MYDLVSLPAFSHAAQRYLVAEIGHLTITLHQARASDCFLCLRNSL